MTQVRPTTFRSTVVVVAVAGLLAVGCGSGSDKAAPSPSATQATSAPGSTATQLPTAAVSGAGSPSPSPTGSGSTVRTGVAAYFVKDEKMAPAARTAVGSGTAASAMRALLQGPTAAERKAGMSSAIPAGTSLRSLRISARTAVVDLSGSFASGGGSFSMGARWAQVVTTLTQFPSVAKVRLWLDGVPATTLGGEGLIVDHAMGRSDVEEWLPAILVDSPAAGAHVTNPVRVRGSADVFEAVLFVALQDSRGRAITTRRVMASSGTGTRGTFDVRVAYPASTGPSTVVAYSLSPKDGRRVNVVTIAVS